MSEAWPEGLPWLAPRQGRVRRWDVVRAGVHVGARGDRWTIPVGFSTDLASIPWPFRWLVDTWGGHTGAALLHDWLCHIARVLGPARWLLARGYGLAEAPPHVTQREADGLFRRMLRLSGMPAPLAWLMYLAVRIGSRFSGGMARDEWAMSLLVLPLGLLVVAVSLPLFLVRGLVDGLGWITERMKR
jgi:hypothetical protein